MRTSRLLILISLFCIFAGCATQRLYTEGEMGGTVPAYEKSQPFFIYGIGQSQDTNIKEICPKGARRVETTQTFLDGFLGVITLGIYTPRTVAVYCKG